MFFLEKPQKIMPKKKLIQQLFTMSNINNEVFGNNICNHNQIELETY